MKTNRELVEKTKPLLKDSFVEVFLCIFLASAFTSNCTFFRSTKYYFKHSGDMCVCIYSVRISCILYWSL